jgi:hypothetical protein
MLAGCAAALQRPEDVSDDGLVRVPTALLDELFVDPTVPLSNYKRVMIDPVEISFTDGWRKDHPELSDHDFEVFSKRLTTMLHDTLVKEFARGGYTLVESPEHDVLRVRASIEDAFFPAPEQSPDKTVQVLSQGRMTLRVQGYDGPSEALVARGRDGEVDPQRRVLERADRVSAQVWAQQVFDEWAQKLRSAMDVAKVHAGARTPNQ